MERWRTEVLELRVVATRAHEAKIDPAGYIIDRLLRTKPKNHEEDEDDDGGDGDGGGEGSGREANALGDGIR